MNQGRGIELFRSVKDIESFLATKPVNSNWFNFFNSGSSRNALSVHCCIMGENSISECGCWLLRNSRSTTTKRPTCELRATTTIPADSSRSYNSRITASRRKHSSIKSSRTGIRYRYRGLPSSWPSKKNIRILQEILKNLWSKGWRNSFSRLFCAQG